MTTATRVTAAVDGVRAAAYRIPTDGPEADGTFRWDATTLVVVHVSAGGEEGLGYTYGDAAVATLAGGLLGERVSGIDAFDIPRAWWSMVDGVRNLGRPGISSMAIAAVDVALWDLKARLLGLPLATLLGRVRDAVPVYGSGGFTTYGPGRVAEQLGGWAADGMRAVKMKIGTHPDDDPARMRAAREAIGEEVELFVDANGAYAAKRALGVAAEAAELGVTWFEEPVSSDDLDGLRLVREAGPPGIDIAAGEYGYDLPYFRRMLDARAVDVLQADASRCAGITGFLGAAALCEAACVPLSAHTAPNIHVHPCCAVGPLRPLEYFHDHVRIEAMLFDGARTASGGELRPDLARPGLGLELKAADAERYAI